MPVACDAEWWRGYVNMVTYGVDASSTVSDGTIDRIADAVLDGRTYSASPQILYEAVGAAVANSRPSAGRDSKQTYLIQLIEALDRRRPWPIHQYTVTDREWQFFAGMPIVAYIPQLKRDIERKLGHGLRPSATDPDVRYIALLLLDGPEVSISVRAPLHEPRAEVRCDRAQDALAAKLRDATELDVRALDEFQGP